VSQVSSNEVHIAIDRDSDIVDARQKGRELAAQIGFTGSDLTLLATAISEIARNIVAYAERGEMSVGIVERNGILGVLVVARDEGPGIADIECAMRDGFSTGNSLGLGLPGAKRLMDEFEIVSGVGKGTTVTMRKWKR
jgi:serine/threonine-protein kinase RsbT